MCSVCHPCWAAITPGYPATLRSQLEFAGGTVSVNSSSSPRAKHPPAPCSLAASSPSSSLQKTKGTSPRPGPLPSSKLGASDQSVPQSQSKPRQAQVALSAPQLTAAFCHHRSARPGIPQRPAFYHLRLARAYGGHEASRGEQQRCWLQTIPMPCSRSVTDTPDTHTRNPPRAQHRQWRSAGQTAKLLTEAARA